MLQRSKSNRSQRRRYLNSNQKAEKKASLNIAQRLEALDDANRCSDGDSSQSSITGPAPPVFASVHRPRHMGLSAMKRDAIPTPVAPSDATTTMTTPSHGNGPGPGHGPQAQPQRPTYQQYQQQRRLQQQQQQQQKTKNNCHEGQQQHLSFSTKQSIAVGIPQAPTVAIGGRSMLQQQQQHYPNGDSSPTKMRDSAMQQQQQQKHQHQNQQLHQLNFNQISKNATNLLNDIYEKHLLSQTTFREVEQQQLQQQLLQKQQQQQQQQQMVNRFIPGRNLRHQLAAPATANSVGETYGAPMRQPQQQPQQMSLVHETVHSGASRPHPHKQQQQQHAKQLMKLPTPPPPPAPTASGAAAQFKHLQQQQQQQQQYQYHFQFSDVYVEPVDGQKVSGRQHFLLESQGLPPAPPPPPAPLNHVYETIKERPPLPPPPPERLRKTAVSLDAEENGARGHPFPPLPPSRQLKKRLLASGTSTGRSSKGGARKSSDAKPARGEKAGQQQPPAYVAPPPAKAPLNQHHHQQQQQQQYNLELRTRADGEQKSYVYQQLREQQQQQQQKLHQAESALPMKTKVQQHQPPLQLQEKQKQPPPSSASAVSTSQREHPLGAATSATATNSNSGSSHNNNGPGSQVSLHEAIPAFDAGNSESTTAVAVLPLVPDGMSVEHTLHQAGLLHQSSASSSYHHNQMVASAAMAATTASTLGGSNHYPQQHPGRPNVLPIVLEEDSGEFQDVVVLEENGTTAKLPYRHGKIEVRLETAQAMAAAAYYARAAQKLAQSSTGKSRNNAANASSSEMPNTSARNGGFCGALQRAPPPLPPGLARRLANKENYGLGKVKVMLRVTDTHTDTENPHFMSVDKKKRQVTLTDPMAASSVAASTSQERGPMVAAPKMFAFDSLFTTDDQQSDVCSSALSEVIPAVLEGSDGCLLTIGYPTSGQARTVLGGVNPPSELGAIPCAISWLYKGINERRQKSGARFSVRVSALGVSATKPDSSSKDLLAAHATDSDDSPGVYLRDDFLGGPTELRAPTAERAALFLDAALAGRPQGGLEPAMIFTLHVYQYSLSRKGGVAGGRSRLHIIDLGGCANRNGGLPLSGIGNILLAILSGQRHPPNKDHPLTPLLKDCLAPVTCHVAIMAHVTHQQTHSDALTTIQLASRIHRLRRRKHRFPMQAEKAAALAAGINGGHQSTGSSAGSGADPSSSELSADTVIYMGPSDDATDGEHPPVYLPSLSSGDNRGVMSKALKGSGVEKQQPQAKATSSTKKTTAQQKAPQSPVLAATNRTGSLKRGHANSPTPQQTASQNSAEQTPFFSPSHTAKASAAAASTVAGTVAGSPKIVAGSLRHPSMTLMSSKGSNVPSPKGSPLRRPGVGGGGVLNAVEPVDSSGPGSPMRKISEEQWIDGPRVSRAKVAEARHLLREVNHVKQCETWIDGPKSQSSRSLTAGNLPVAPSQVQGYGFMDQHKKSMIRQWVENQTSQVFQSMSVGSSPTHLGAAHRDKQAQHLRNITYHMSQLKQKSLDGPEDLYATSTRQLGMQPGDQHSLRGSQLELVQPIGAGLTTAISTTNASAPAEIRGASHYRQSASTNTQSSNFLASHQTATANNDETDLHSTHSHAGYGTISAVHHLPPTSASDSGGHHGVADRLDRQAGDCDEDQDSGPSEVPPALPLIEPLGSREISHESLHRILSRHVSRESLFQQQDMRRHEDLVHSPSRQSSHHYSQHSMGMSDCGLQVTEEEIARTMGSEHPLAALSHCDNMSIVSSFQMAGGDAFSDCAMGERTRNQFDQLARLREIFTSQLAMAEVTPVFRSGCDVGSVYSEPAYRFNTGPGSVCSEPPYKPPSPRQLSRSPSQGSLPSLNGIMQIAGMEQYASLRHPDGASDPNLPKVEKPFIMEHEDICEVDEKSALLSPSKRPSVVEEDQGAILNHLTSVSLPITSQSHLPLLPLNTSSEAYDSGHDSSTPRTSKHSGISRRAESGYHSVATARDSDESSFTSGLSKEHHNRITMPASVVQKKKRQDKGLCNWLMNPFTCTYPETEGEISDF